MNAKEAVQVTLREYGQLIRSLTDAIASAHLTGTASGQSPEQVIQRIIKHDELLQKRLHDLSRHQEVQQRISSLQQQLDHKEQFARQIAQQLHELEQSLTLSITEGRKLLGEAGGVALGVEDVVQYAQRIAFTTSAPPKPWMPGAPLFNYRPPMPQEAQMRSGWLYMHTLSATADALPHPTGDVTKPSVPAHVAQWKKEESNGAPVTAGAVAAAAAAGGGSMAMNINPIAKPEERIDLDINPGADDDEPEEWESGS